MTRPGGTERALPALVALAAVFGVLAPGPGRSLADGVAVEVTLAVLVFSSGVGVEVRAVARLRRATARLGAVWVVATLTLPALGWAVARMVPAGDLRVGVLALGVAPTEIAALAMTSIAGGAVAAAGALLLASMVATVATAGPLLGFLAGAADVDTAATLRTLVLVVAVPFGVGMLAGHRPVGRSLRPLADPVAVVSVSVLAWLVASQVEWSDQYGWVVLAVAAFLAGGIALGSLLARAVGRELRSATMLAVSMRDFAVAAGVAVAAVGPAAAGPLGIYGVAVLAWGSLAAGWHARRP